MQITFEHLYRDHVRFSVWPARNMPERFTLVRRYRAARGYGRDRKPIARDSYYEHIEFNDLVVHRQDDPKQEVYYYNKPHDQFCFAHITMLLRTWQPNDYQFHVTVNVPDSPSDPAKMELVYQNKEHVKYRALKLQGGVWTYQALPSRTRLSSNTQVCADSYAEAFISYLNNQFAQYQGGSFKARKLSSKRSCREAGQKSSAKSIDPESFPHSSPAWTEWGNLSGYQPTLIYKEWFASPLQLPQNFYLQP